jgi:hypothetical protein
MGRWALLGLEGFRVIGRRTYSFYVWSLVNLTGFVLVIAPLSLTGGPFGPADTPSSRLWRLAALLVFAPLLWSVLVCATYRSVFEPGDSRFAYLRLGRAEARMAVFVLLVQIALSLSIIGATLAGAWSILVGLGAVALWARTAFLGPAIFRGEAPLKTGWRLSGLHYREVLVMSIVTIASCVALGVTIMSAWMFFTQRLIQPSPPPVGQLALLRVVYPALAPLMLGWTAVLVIGAAPAAAAYRALTNPGDGMSTAAEAA